MGFRASSGSMLLGAIAAGLLLASCGSGGGGGGGEAPPSGSGAYLVVGSDGSVRTAAVAETLSGDRLLFVRSAATGLYVGVHPVTRQQWEALMGTQPWSGVPGTIVADSGLPGLPAWNLSRDDADACASTLASRTGLAVGLPSAALWRAEVGDGEYPWGASTATATVALHAVTAETRTIDGPSPVGGRQATAAGLHDLIGNVRQWTADGVLVGGSWSDGIVQSGRSCASSGVPTTDRHPLSGARLVIARPEAGNASPTAAGDALLPAMRVGEPVNVSAATLLAGAADADGDPLRVVGFGGPGVRLTGSGPWTITPLAAGAVALSYLIVDGRGGAVQRTARGAAAPAPSSAYDRYADYRGLLRSTARSAGRFPRIATLDTAAHAVVEHEFAFRLSSFEGWTAGTATDAVLCRGEASGTRSTLVLGADGRIDLRDEAGALCRITADGGPAPGEVWRCRLRFTATEIALFRRNGGDWDEVGTVARGAFARWVPSRLLIGGASQSCNGAVYSWMMTADGTVLHDYRMDEMAGEALADAADPAATGAANVQTGYLEWIDDIPTGQVPDAEFAVEGPLVHGGTLVLTGDGIGATGGVPGIRLYDDGTVDGGPRSGLVVTGTTISGGGFIPWSEVRNPGPLLTYKPGGPGGRAYVVDYDGATGERLSRGVDLPDGFSEAFMSRSLRIPADRAWPGGHDGGAPWTPVAGYIPGDSTWKTDWLLTDDDGGATGSDLVLGTHASGDLWSVSGNSVSDGNAEVSIHLRPAIAFGSWFSARTYVRHNPAAPTASLAVSSLSTTRVGTQVARANGSVLAVRSGYEPFRLWLSGAWIDKNALCRAERADIYAAFGPDAACRIEIGDSPVYGRCTALATCPPLTWAADRIEVRCALGVFVPATTTLYAFIIGPDGVPLHLYGKRLN